MAETVILSNQIPSFPAIGRTRWRHSCVDVHHHRLSRTASGRALHFGVGVGVGLFVSLLTFLSLKDLHTCTRSMTRINRVGRFGGHACICLKLREVHRSCIRTHIYGSSRNKILVLLNVNRPPESAVFPFLFPLVSMVVCAERMALYIGPCFSFRPDYMHIPYNSKEVNHILPSSIVRISLLLQ